MSDAGSLQLAHSSDLVRTELASALQAAGVTSLRTAASWPEAAAQLHDRPADLSLVELGLGQHQAGDLVAATLDAGARSVVVLAPTVREHDLLAALEAGALGYLSRDTPVDRVVYDVVGALRGEACLPRDKLAPVLRLLIDRRREEDDRVQRLARLSKRETEVLEHLASGATNDDIAGRLFLSQATVRTHVQNILSKLEVHSRLEAIALADGVGSHLPSSRGDRHDDQRR